MNFNNWTRADLLNYAERNGVDLSEATNNTQRRDVLQAWYDGQGAAI